MTCNGGYAPCANECCKQCPSGQYACGDACCTTMTATAIAVGENHACAITSAGGLRCFGDNEYGELGTGNVTNAMVAMDVVGLGSGVTAVAAGEKHTCAVHNGAVKCWGDNSLGQLGAAGPQTNTPVVVAGTPSGVTQLVAGDDYTCALAGESMTCWGYNELGAFGIGTRSSSSPLGPTPSGPSSHVTQIAAAQRFDHLCAIEGDALQCWGDNSYGELGNNSLTTSLSPVNVTTMSSGVTSACVAMPANASTTCAVRNGAVYCWGELPEVNGASYNKTPVAKTELSSGVAQIVCGSQHACVRTTAGDVQCWGDWIGEPASSASNTPTSVAGAGPGASALASGPNFTCALDGGGHVQCWGVAFL
jgi:alpha-tubulin suppressor-like RCC1 family protein